MRQLSATTGLPHVLVRRNMEKIRGRARRASRPCSTASPAASTSPCSTRATARWRATRSASSRARRRSASCCPSNSPGVHSLWVPDDRAQDGARPQAGQRRAVDALPPRSRPSSRRARRPRPSASTRPTTRAPARSCAAAGAAWSSATWPPPGAVAGRPAGRGARPRLQQGACSAPTRRPTGAQHLDVMVSSIAENGGRSCVNASGVWTTAHAPRDRRGAGRAARRDRAARGGRPGGAARAVRRTRTSRGASRP